MEIAAEGVEVTQRFFEVIAYLRANKIIGGLSTFADRYNINRGNLNTVKCDPTGHILKTELVVYLVRDYDVSPEWILLGKGEMFRENSTNRIPLSKRIRQNTELQQIEK